MDIKDDMKNGEKLDVLDEYIKMNENLQTDFIENSNEKEMSLANDSILRNDCEENLSEDEEDNFESEEELNKAIEALLEDGTSTLRPVIHDRLQFIINRLTKENIQKEHLDLLIREIDEYLEIKINKYMDKAEIDNHLIKMSRSLVLDSLNLYREVCPLLKNLVNSNDDTSLNLILSIMNQAQDVMIRGKNLVIQAEPK